MGQAVLERRHLISDSLGVSTFDHACVRLGRKGQAATNTPTYFMVILIAAEKSFYCRGRWHHGSICLFVYQW